MAGFTGEQRGQVDKFLGRFTGLGGALGKQARKAKGQLGAQEVLEQGLIRPDQFEQTAQDIARQEEPMNQQVAAGIKEGYAKIQAAEIAIHNKELAAINRLAAAAEAFEKAANVEKAQINDTKRKFVTGDKQVREGRIRDQDIATAKQKEMEISRKQATNAKLRKPFEEKIEAERKSRAKTHEEKQAEVARIKRDLEVNPPKKRVVASSGGRGHSSHQLSMTSNKQRPDKRIKQLETAERDAALYAPLDTQQTAALLPGLDEQEAKQYRTLLGTRQGLAGQRTAAREGIDRVRQEHGVINSRGYSPEATQVNPTTAFPQGRPASVAPTLTKAQRNLQRFAEKGTAGQKRFAQKKLEEQKAVLDVNIAPQQVQINIPEIGNIVADVMQKTALKEVAKAFSNYVANLQGSDGSPEATAQAGQYGWPR
jgi:hypothetical protein